MARKIRKRGRNRIPKNRNKNQKTSLISSPEESLDGNRVRRSAQQLCPDEVLRLQLKRGLHGAAAAGQEKAGGLAQIMSVHRIAVKRISAEALKGVIEEFVSRSGTDYGEIEVPTETKFRQVKSKLEKRLMHLTSDCPTINYPKSHC